MALANQIAAGEVIERPASCIKELLENSLDAGATEIHIDIDAGGLRQMVITDNGLGIEKQDLLLSLAAHATSKIQSHQDLFHLTTLGFRGEALASIQAVSKVEITSKRPGAESKAYKLVAYTDMPIVETYFSGEQGTQIRVKDLFYNVPVRKKFLKSVKTDYFHIENLVTALALSHPEVAIYFNHNDKPVYFLPQALTPKQVQGRVSKLLGKNFIDHAVELNIERVGLVLTGFLGLPQSFSRTNGQQYFYINGRLIKDKLITHAIKSFFQTQQLLSPGMYPAYVLYLTISPEEVDVNVHPTKHEVRFHEPRLIHDFITSALASVLRKTGLIISTDNNELPESPSENSLDSNLDKPSIQYRDLEYQKSPTIALLKQATEPSCTPSFSMNKKTDDLFPSIIKIGPYLLLGESALQPEAGRVIDIASGQEALIAYFFSTDQQHDWFEAKPLLVALSISTPYMEQWIWPERQAYFAKNFGLIYQFKNKAEILITHLPKVLKYMTHQERLDKLTQLFQAALHNGITEWETAGLQLFMNHFLCRLPSAEWAAQFSWLQKIEDKSFVQVLTQACIRDFLSSDKKEYF